ncbi:MAG: arsenite methyltransferase [Rhodothermales bacterium]|jgi:arsenite methyltransferase
MQDSESTRESVSEYYGKTLSTNSDLKTSACCNVDSIPARHREILSKIEDEVLIKFYGCGSPLPDALENCTVLDLGCGTGRDAYLAAALAGKNGRIIGIDMTDEQLDVARRHAVSQTRKFGLTEANVDFRKGIIEDLEAAGIPDNSIDVVISNCVINLSPNKHKVFSEIFRVLKPGGELYFSDVYSDRRIPENLRQDPVLYGECLSGALYIEDFRRILREFGCLDYRVVSQTEIEMTDPEVEAAVGLIRFYSITVRAFKLDSVEDVCEDYGQVATYNGTLPDWPNFFDLDDHHCFETGKPMLVCGNTAAMLSETRYARHFEVVGDREQHFGVFECEEPAPIEVSGGCC